MSNKDIFYRDKSSSLSGRLLGNEHVYLVPETEKIEKWTTEINEILEAIEFGDENFLETIIFSVNQDIRGQVGGVPLGLRKVNANEIFNLLKDEDFFRDKQAKTMLAIGLWVIQAIRWEGMWDSHRKLLKGGRKNLSDLRENGVRNCFDSTAFAKIMFPQYKIEGDIASIGPHRFWIANDGRVLDVWWGMSERGGVFESKEDLEEY